jgi:predicted nucleotidyltransferase
MTRAALRDPYQAVIQAFNRHGVRYVVVGMAGINYYARSPAEAFATLDYDIFLEPTLRNVEQALKSLRHRGFTIGTTAGPLHAEALKDAVRVRRTLVATTTDGLVVELLLQVSGYAFTDLMRDAATFTLGGVPVKVGRLEKLVRSKRLAGRPKDRDFLRRYRSLLLSEDEPST